MTQIRNSPYSLGGDTQQAGGLSLSPTGTLGFAVTAQDCPHGNCYGTNSISTFSRDLNSGELTLMRLTQTSGQVGSVVVDGSGEFAYAPTYLEGIRAFGIKQDGTLSELQDSPFATVFGGLTRNSDGTFIGVGYRPSDFLGPFVTSFRPDQNGTPLPLQAPIGFAAIAPVAFCTDAEGQYLFVLDDDALHANLHVFSLLPRGSIQEVSGSPFEIVHSGRSLVINPNLQWIYAVGTTSGGAAILQYKFDPASGSVGPIVSSTALSSVTALRISDSGKFLIVSNLPMIYIYEIDTSTGTLRAASSARLF